MTVEVVELGGGRAGGVELGLQRQAEHLAGAVGDVGDLHRVQLGGDGGAVAALAVERREAAAAERQQQEARERGGYGLTTKFTILSGT